MTTLGILSPGFPDIAGGVRDHTRRLVASWTASGCTVLTEGSLGIAARELAESWHHRGATALLIQYVPFLYGRRGLSRYPHDLAVRARQLGLRVTVFVHEPWVPPARLPWLLLSPLQRRQLLRLVQHASSVVTAVPAWQRLLGPGTELVYVGSTLGDPPPANGGAQLPAPVAFSITAAGMNVDWIAAAAEAISASPALIVLGTSAGSARRHDAVAPWFDPSWDWRGHLPAPQVMDALNRAPLVLAPYVDGATGRRTSLLAALSTGVRVVTSDGHLQDPILGGGPLTVAGTRERFAAAARQVWQAPDSSHQRAQRVAWYREHFDPNRLDARLLSIVAGSPA